MLYVVVGLYLLIGYCMALILRSALAEKNREFEASGENRLPEWFFIIFAMLTWLPMIIYGFFPKGGNMGRSE